MYQDRFWQLIAKKLSGEACIEELQELNELIKLHPDLLYAAQHIEDLWNLEQPVYTGAENAFELHLKKTGLKSLHFPAGHVPDQLEKLPMKRKRFSIILSVTVVFLLIAIVSGYFLYTQGKKNGLITSEKRISEFSTQKGSKSRLVLPDSSIIILNSGSKIIYNEQFGATNRDLALTGEAFFDVRKSVIPFIIHTNNIQIRVLGTAFNVRSYPDDKTTETSLIRGRVEILLDKRPDMRYILAPDQKISIKNTRYDIKEAGNRSYPIVMVRKLGHLKDSSVLETSWVDNKLAFEDESFTDIARKMERWYGVDIQIKDTEIAQEHMTGTFEKESITQALDALSITSRFHYSMKSDSIIITK